MVKPSMYNCLTLIGGVGGGCRGAGGESVRGQEASLSSLEGGPEVLDYSRLLRSRSVGPTWLGPDFMHQLQRAADVAHMHETCTETH